MKNGNWFWYGGGRNTCAEPTDLKTAKKEAMAHIKSVETNDKEHPTADDGR